MNHKKTNHQTAPGQLARTFFYAALLAATTAVPTRTYAQTSDTPQEYTIPSGNLGDALRQLAAQSKLQIVFSPELVKGKAAPGLSGTHTWRTALQQLLKGTGLSWELINNSTVVITKPAPSEKPPASPAKATEASSSDAAPVRMAEVLVQGSRSLNADIERSVNDPQPYVVFGRADIERSGAININDFLLKRVSANNSSDSPAQGGEIGGDRSSINLRGLGEGQTLILVDGRRLASQTFGTSGGQPNLNGIPIAAVERIEILPTTASAIYGGSATGGVINVILRRGYEGAEVAVSHDNSFDTDSSIDRVDFTYGTSLANGSTSVMVNASVTESNALLNRDREFFKRGTEHVLANYPGYLGTQAGATPNIYSATGANLVLDNGTPLNSRFTYVPAGYQGPASDGAAALAANAGRINTDPSRIGGLGGGAFPLTPAPQTKSLAASVRHSFTDNLDGFLDVSHSATHSTETGGTSAILRLEANDPRNPFQQPINVTLAPQKYNGTSEKRNEQDRASAGLIARLPGGWAGSADFTWSRANVQFTVRPGTINAAGLVASGFNPLIDHEGLGTLDLGAFAPGPFSSNSAIPLTSYTYNPTLRLGGPIWQLPGGAVTASFLLEQQKTKFSDSTWQASALSILFPSRSQDVRSAYAEFRVPLFSEKNARPGLQGLDLQLAIRRDDYRSTSGNFVYAFPGLQPPAFKLVNNEAAKTTGLVGLKYVPIKGLAFRASHGTGFVPPDVTQLGAPGRVENYLSGTPDPRRGNTTATVPAVVMNGSNPNLKPEDSKTTSFGVILEPTFLDGFRTSLDYTKLKKTNNISFISEAQLLQFESMFPDRIKRGAPLATDPAGWAGPVIYWDESSLNVARSWYDNLDLQMKYGFDLDSGAHIELWGNATWTLKAETQLLPGVAVTNLKGISARGGQSMPLNFRGFYGVDYEKNGWGLGWNVRHYSSYLVADPSFASSAPILAAQGNGGRVPRQILHDLSFRWHVPSYSEKSAWDRFLSNLDVSGGIRNVFNEKPAIDVSNAYSYFSYLGDPRLRTYYLQAKYSF